MKSLIKFLSIGFLNMIFQSNAWTQDDCSVLNKVMLNISEDALNVNDSIAEDVKLNNYFFIGFPITEDMVYPSTHKISWMGEQYILSDRGHDAIVGYLGRFNESACKTKLEDVNSKIKTCLKEQKIPHWEMGGEAIHYFKCTIGNENVIIVVLMTDKDEDKELTVAIMIESSWNFLLNGG